MTGIGSIRFQAVQASRLREATLAHAVATVDQDEALNGASKSDVVRLAHQERSRDDGPQVPLSVYLSRAAQFRAQVKQKSKAEEAPQSECPIDKARAESATGENAPVNWLIADHFGGQSEVETPSKEEFVTPSTAEAESKEVFSSAPKINAAPQSLMADEWLLSPCA